MVMTMETTTMYTTTIETTTTTMTTTTMMTICFFISGRMLMTCMFYIYIRPFRLCMGSPPRMLIQPMIGLIQPLLPHPNLASSGPAERTLFPQSSIYIAPADATESSDSPGCIRFARIIRFDRIIRFARLNQIRQIMVLLKVTLQISRQFVD